MSAIVVVGESVLDLVQLPDGSREEHPGGSPANVAVGLARLGNDVTLVTELGDDPHGSKIRDHLVASGVDVRAASSGAGTATALARIDHAGAATYEFNIKWLLSTEPGLLPAAVDHIHVGSISSHIGPGNAEVGRIVRAIRPGATVSYDPNIRPGLSGERRAVVRDTESFVKVADFAKASDEDLKWLYPDLALDEVAARWLDLGARLVVATLAAEGSRVWCNGTTIQVPPRKVSVIDTVGAGDSYMAALIDGLYRRGLTSAHGRDALANTPIEVIGNVVERAADAAAITVARPGANPPWEHELAIE